MYEVKTIAELQLHNSALDESCGSVMSYNVNYHFSGWCQSHCPIWNRAALLHTKNSDVQIQVSNKRTCDVGGQNLHSSQIGRNTSQLRHQPQWKRGGLDGADQESYTGWLSSIAALTESER